LTGAHIDSPWAELNAAVGTDAIFDGDKGPAIRAHTAGFHGFIVAIEISFPLLESRDSMGKTELEHREDMVRVCRLIYEKGWAAMNDGNVSIRLGDDRILCTPTGVSKGMLSADELIACDMAGNKVEGKRDRTSEITMHLTVYSMRPDVQSVVHAHPPVATGFATAGRALDKALLPEVIVQLGAVPLAAYGLPGTPALSEGMLPYIPRYDALLLENHGCTSYGRDVWEAFFRMEMVEHLARITFVAEMLGGARPLPREEVEKLFAARARYNVTSHSGMEPGMPVVAEDLLESQTP
jgi:L-fuculose-phosphate aldolase